MASTRERNGRYTGLYRDSAGKQKSAGTFGTERQALKAAEYAEALENPPKPVEIYPAQKRGKVTVSAYARTWLENQVLEETSRETYRRTAEGSFATSAAWPERTSPRTTSGKCSRP